ncbi:aminotransferase-like domain-containing protein [Nocardia yamanashiensis]|uniref:aminotransferase-like domain-containing protein n=1 Tax=Nocardia yamanashiensis TaxID=209247 RepID=UPI00082D307F|nr:PLP-dependent aminotransferase family protein [Nocardia yamanashiensis]
MRTYREVAAELAARITDGRWAPGHRLPTHRRLAAEYGIAVATATRVYAELERAGLVVGEPGRGTFVRDRSLRLSSASAPSRTDARERTPVRADLAFTQPLSPSRADLLRTALRELAGAGDLDAVLRQQPPGGRPHDREIVADFLRRRDVPAHATEVVLTNGAQHALDLVVRAMFSPGDVIAVDDLTYPGFKSLARAHGLELAPIPTTATGPDLAALSRLCAHRPVRAIYTMPTLHNPLGWVLDASQRRELVSIARHHDLLLIEDAAYAFLADPAPRPLAAAAPERTFWLSSLSKSVAAGLRFGMLVVPPTAAPAIGRTLRTTMASPPGLISAVAIRWLADGTVDTLEHAGRLAAEHHQRILHRELGHLHPIAHPRSYFAWLPIDPDQRMDRIAAELSRRGIRVCTADLFATTPHVPHALRLALGSPATEELPAVLAEVRAVFDTVEPR